MRSQPASIVWTVTSAELHFIIVEVAWKVLIYDLDVLFIFYINPLLRNVVKCCKSVSDHFTTLRSKGLT